MGKVGDEDSDDNYSTIGDRAEVSFLDFEVEKSIHGFEPTNEGPVIVSLPFPSIGGKVQSVLVGETTSDSITIQNTTEEPLDLWRVTIFSSTPEDAFTLSLLEPPSATADVETIREFLESSSLEDRVLQPAQTLTIWLSCKPKVIGLQTAIVHFDVGDEQIERVVFLLAEDKVSQLLASNKPYSRLSRRKQFNTNSQYVPASRPSRGAVKQGWKYRLPHYLIPPESREMIESGQLPGVLFEGLTSDNYANFFTNLLIMEEIHLEEEMRGYDMENVTMRSIGNTFLALEVPGLAEKRPSIVNGDYIFVRDVSGSINDKPYQGFVHRVQADEVFLKFAKEFHNLHRERNLYNVSFTYNRVTMRRQYQAVEAAECVPMEILFPSLSSSKKRSIQTSTFVPINVNLNEEQFSSVEMILGCDGGPPYVIHGPPGTGKTMTLVEAILQLYMSRKQARILVCASSNSAADHLLEKLINRNISMVQEHEIFRLNANSRPYEDVPSDLIRFCFFQDFVFECPQLKALLRYRIIICTYMSASLIYAEGIQKSHFSHIFCDEAGQASEPEMMISLANLCDNKSVVVLAGDPMQLGPVIYSRDAESYGLGKSYLERLFKFDLYGDENENFVTKLVRNYRCHPAILELPSKLFYNGELIACKEKRDSSISEWEELPNREFPVLFVGIQGYDEREGTNPSWFNRFEASKVVDIIKKLTESAIVSEGDIGVITPYRQQVLKLKKAFESLGMEGLKVGSVEQFQGQERQVIIISTVRSTIKHNEFDRVFNLGFLSNPRRFNVATTRARSLLIVVGNPHIISKDPNWDKLLRHCADNDSCQGCPLPPPENPDHDDEDSVPQGDFTSDHNTNQFSDVGWGEESSNVEETHKPFIDPTDEAEWSDGWS